MDSLILNVLRSSSLCQTEAEQGGEGFLAAVRNTNESDVTTMRDISPMN